MFFPTRLTKFCSLLYAHKIVYRACTQMNRLFTQISYSRLCRKKTGNNKLFQIFVYSYLSWQFSEKTKIVLRWSDGMILRKFVLHLPSYVFLYDSRKNTMRVSLPRQLYWGCKVDVFSLFEQHSAFIAIISPTQMRNGDGVGGKKLRCWSCLRTFQLSTEICKVFEQILVVR